MHQVHAGVYSLTPRQLLSRQGWWMAAVLASGPDALLSHNAAAALWGVRGYSGGAVHITVPHKSTSTKRIRRHFPVVPADEQAVEEGIPLTSVHRSALHAAGFSVVHLTWAQLDVEPEEVASDLRRMLQG